MLRLERFVTFVAVAKQYQVDCGTDGVAKLMTDSFAQAVKANHGYGAELTSFRPLSVAEADDIGLQRHEDYEVTWYRLEGTAFPMITLVGQ
jgi:hypothetical protein